MKVVVITKHGKPVAKLVPYRETRREDRRRVIEEMRAGRDCTALDRSVVS